MMAVVKVWELVEVWGLVMEMELVMDWGLVMELVKVGGSEMGWKRVKEKVEAD
jgi:hypothetical protein